MAATVGTLDAKNRIPARLSALGVSLNFYGRCLGISSGEISNLLGSRKRLTGSKSKELTDMVDDLELVARAFSPAPVLFKDPDTILGLISQLKDGSLLVGVSERGSLKISGTDNLTFDGGGF
jgi:hypothetical protein